MKPRIMVAGATGSLGYRIVGALLKRGAKVAVLVRPGSFAEQQAALRYV